MNPDLRLKIVTMIKDAKEGHIPSSFSIVDILDFLYSKILRINKKKPNDLNRDFFILSKGHGCAAYYAVLEKYGYMTKKTLSTYSSKNSILGGHPDSTKIPFIEASTGSLGHGFPFACGIALGLKILKKNSNRVISLLGDGECQEGTVWEAANVARNRRLGNLCAIVDWNKSGMTLMPEDDMPKKWAAFGWNVEIIDGHNEEEMAQALERIEFKNDGIPSVIIANTIKGKGVPFIEGHGKWHHRIPNQEEYKKIIGTLV